jgi:formate dehydrogenase subunit gamma
LPAFPSSAPPQPRIAIHTPEAAAVERALAAHARRPGALLPVLHAVQDALGHIPASAVPVIAQALNLSRAEVHGVVRYYHHFRSAPPGRHVVQVCAAEACQACGAAALMAQAEQLLGCKAHETRADGAVTLQPVYCLGLCASSPAVQIDERLHGRVAPQRLARLVAELGLSA